MKNESKIICKFKRIKKRIRRLDVLIAVLIFTLFLSIPLLLNVYFKITLGTLGTFGDFFGSFNSIFSALAFGGVILSLYFQRKDLGLQRKDLELQRKELELTRKELERQAVAQESSAAEQKKYSELLSKQIETNIRPYLNVYIDFNGTTHALIIENVGRCACRDFYIECSLKGTVDLEYESYARELENWIKSVKIDVIPAGNEYALVLDNPSKGKSLSDLYGPDVFFEMKFLFKGLKNEDKQFKMNFNLNCPALMPTKRSKTGIKEIVDSLEHIKGSIDSFKPFSVAKTLCYKARNNNDF